MAVMENLILVLKLALICLSYCMRKHILIH